MSEKVYAPVKLLTYITNKYKGLWELVEKDKIENIIRLEQMVEILDNNNLVIKDFAEDTQEIYVTLNWRKEKTIFKIDEVLKNDYDLVDNSIELYFFNTFAILEDNLIYIDYDFDFGIRGKAVGFFIKSGNYKYSKNDIRSSINFYFMFENNKVVQYNININIDNKYKLRNFDSITKSNIIKAIHIAQDICFKTFDKRVNDNGIEEVYFMEDSSSIEVLNENDCKIVILKDNKEFF